MYIHSYRLPLYRVSFFTMLALLLTAFTYAQTGRTVLNFNQGWKFRLGTDSGAINEQYNDAAWRTLNLPHDWSVEGKFDEKNPATTGGGALPGGIGWYRKTFTLPAALQQQQIFIDFDGVYCNSEAWINGHYLGKRPNGYISFQYELTPWLKKDGRQNVLVVKADNSQQPNSRWYSGSGIYRNVWLTAVNEVHVGHWGTYVTTPQVSNAEARVVLNIDVCNTASQTVETAVKTVLLNAAGKQVAFVQEVLRIHAKDTAHRQQVFTVTNPVLWSDEAPYLYKAVTTVKQNGKITDTYTTPVGIRSFVFDQQQGFLLNGQPVKIKGVCNHHDLGCLGTAINKRALQRQLEILKGMGCNAIRTSHNPPAPELLDLCDEMGFIVMDEAFDMWEKQKNPYDYHLAWQQWHRKDLEDQLKRDRNHPSVFIWSVGNEIPEQWGKDNDTTGRTIVRELVSIVRSLDATRPTVTANNETASWNNLLLADALDITGYNYHHQQWDSVFTRWPSKPFIVTEATSALETRGHYDLFPSDSIRRWPERWDKPFRDGNADLTVNSYDNVSAPWGSTHEESLKVLQKYKHISGMFVWTGFDYIGEPTPYPWPARSSYFGIIDLAGFPKDVYYLYQSVWTNKPVLHILPHWNWKQGDTVDVWAYYSQADEVELLLNGQSLGTRKKQGDDMHVFWHVPYTPGTLQAISRKNGAVVATQTIQTAGAPARIELTADRQQLHADGSDLSFVTVRVLDAHGVPVPDAANNIHFQVNGNASIAGVDNGSETSMESFKGNERKIFNGLCLAVIQAGNKAGKITLTATADGLQQAQVEMIAH